MIAIMNSFDSTYLLNNSIHLIVSLNEPITFDTLPLMIIVLHSLIQFFWNFIHIPVIISIIDLFILSRFIVIYLQKSIFPLTAMNSSNSALSLMNLISHSLLVKSTIPISIILMLDSRMSLLLIMIFGIHAPLKFISYCSLPSFSHSPTPDSKFYPTFGWFMFNIKIIHYCYLYYNNNITIMHSFLPQYIASIFSSPPP